MEKPVRNNELININPIIKYLFVNQNILLTFAVPERRYVENYDHY